MASYAVTKEHIYFSKCNCVLLDILQNFLRAILSSKIEEKDIFNVAQAKRVLLRISKQQWSLIHSCSYSNFDIAILYQLIRHLTDTEPPRNGWGKISPLSEEQTVGDVVEHIRRIRNEDYGHHEKVTMSEPEFQKTWDEFTEICKIMDTVLPGNNYSVQLKGILEAEFGENEKRYNDETLQQVRERLKGIDKMISDANPSTETGSLCKEDEIKLRDTLLHTCQDQRDFIILSPLVKNYGLPIDTLYIPLTIKEKVFIKHHHPLSRHEEHNCESRSVYFFDDLLARSNQEVQRIFLYGVAGGGKTCYTLKLLSLWRRCHSGQSEEIHIPVENELEDIDFVFYIAMKHTEGETVEDIVCNDTSLLKDANIKHAARKALRSADYRCLVILDGLDKCSNNKIPSTQNLRNCQVLFTSRQSKIAVMNPRYEVNDNIVELQSFSHEDTENLVQVILKSFFELDVDSEDFTSKCQKIIGHLRTSSLRHISRIPFVATYLILLLYDDKDIIRSVPSLYFEVISILIQRAIYEDRITHATDSELRESTYLKQTHKIISLKDEHASALLQIGSYAFDILMAESMKDGFQVTNVSKPFDDHVAHFANVSKPFDDHVAHFGIETGILSKPIIPSITRPRQEFEFFHRSITELVASMFLWSDETAHNFQMILKRFTHVDKMLNSKLFFTFIAGFCPHYCLQMYCHLTHLSKSYARENPCHFPFHHDRRARMRATYSLSCNFLNFESGTGVLPSGSLTSHGSNSLDVYVDEDSEKKKRYITSLILERNANIVSSLFLENIPEDDEYLNQSVLGDFLHRMVKRKLKSLNHLYIRGRYLKSLEIPRLTTLVLRDVALDIETMKRLTDAIKRNSLLKNLRLTNLKCRQPYIFLHLNFHNLTNLESLTLETLQLTSPSFVSIQSAVKSSKALKSLRLSEMNTGRRVFDFELENKTSLTELYLHQIKLDPDVFQIHREFLASNINLMELHLDNITYGKADLVFSCKRYLRTLQLADVTLSQQSMYNLSILIQETLKLEVLILDTIRCDDAVLELDLSRKEHLERLYLSSVNIENIRLFSNMTKLDNVILIDVSMSEQDWDVFLRDLTVIQHIFDIDLDGVNINEEQLLTLVIGSGHFIVDRKPLKKKSGGYIIRFTTTLYETYTSYS